MQYKVVIRVATSGKKINLDKLKDYLQSLVYLDLNDNVPPLPTIHVDAIEIDWETLEEEPK